MGGCFGRPKDMQNALVQEEIDRDAKIDKKVKKLLLLGSGGSGKSTLFKQLQNIHGGGFETRDRRTFKTQIYEQIIEAMKNMIDKCEIDVKYMKDYQLKPENAISSAFISNVHITNELTPEIVHHLQLLWSDPAIQDLYSIRNKICVPDSTKYFLDNIDKISDPNYIPSDNDLLLVRYRTTGIAEKDFIINDKVFKICDVGGQRNERRKWINFFDSVTAVIFVAALSCYDEVTFEDESTNAMLESLEVFEQQLNSPTFRYTAFILFLNKKDVFEEKIKKSPLTTCFPDYEGGQDYDSCAGYIQEQFESKNLDPDNREVYTHITTATDPHNIKKVFSDVQHIVISWSLEQSGLV